MTTARSRHQLAAVMSSRASCTKQVWSSRYMIIAGARKKCGRCSHLEDLVADSRAAEGDGANISSRELERRPQSSQLCNCAAQAVPDDDNALRSTAVRHLKDHLPMPQLSKGQDSCRGSLPESTQCLR